MSTREIHEAIEYVQALSDAGGPNADALGITARAAARRLEAIEKAAKEVARGNVYAQHTRTQEEALALFESIASEAK